MSLVLVDSSAFLSLEDAAERSHEGCKAALAGLVASGARLVTTNFVFDETYTLLLVRLGRTRARAWGESFRAGRLVQRFRIEEHHEERAWEIITTYEDKGFSYTDATSFALAEELGIEAALSLDDHFRAFGRFSVLP